MYAFPCPPTGRFIEYPSSPSSSIFDGASTPSKTLAAIPLARSLRAFRHFPFPKILFHSSNPPNSLPSPLVFSSSSSVLSPSLDDNFAGLRLPPVNQTVSRFFVSGSGKMYPFTDITARIRFVGDGVVVGSGCPTSEGGSIVIEIAISYDLRNGRLEALSPSRELHNKATSSFKLLGTQAGNSSRSPIILIVLCVLWTLQIRLLG
mmetsp:Transcript_26723/g.41917  ORF Transcript_26723/g.41917 Transcript_26723/m.41917 type:complete len:205 (-) Transcript_26723:1978-2592(-)